MAEKKIGKAVHYYDKISVALIELSNTLKIDDEVRIKSMPQPNKKKLTDFTQKIKSMQINYKNVKTAGSKKVIGLKVNEEVQEGDIVYKIT